MKTHQVSSMYALRKRAIKATVDHSGANPVALERRANLLIETSTMPELLAASKLRETILGTRPDLGFVE